MPVIKHYTGNCHVYVDATADLDMAERILVNAKCQRMGVCNAAESLLVHALVANEFLPRAARRWPRAAWKFAATNAPASSYPAQEATVADYAAEFLGPVISVRVVGSLDEAIEHINRYGSRHTDAIVTRDDAAAQQFTAAVDSSAVMVNASTRFNDGAAFGLGAEIGISTDKLHAAGHAASRSLPATSTSCWATVRSGNDPPARRRRTRRLRRSGPRTRIMEDEPWVATISARQKSRD